jgi:myo-inositol catabolism protein IolS
MDKIKKRLLGKSGIEISEIGFGAWPIGGSAYGDTSDSDGLEALETYIEAGGNHIDTARSYGRSETLTGDVLSKLDRSEIFLATKTAQGEFVESIPEVRKELEESLRELKTDYVDLYYLHHPPDDIETMNRTLDEFEALKQEGKIKLIGASIKAADVTPHTLALCNQYIDSGRVDAIEIVYSILRQFHSKMFTHAYQEGVGIIARTSIESGFLSGKYKPGFSFTKANKNDHRARWPEEKQNKIFSIVEELKNWAVKPPFQTIPQVAIKFSLAPKEVSSLIVGARNANQAKMNIETALLPDIEQNIIEKLIKEYSDTTELANIGKDIRN